MLLIVPKYQSVGFWWERNTHNLLHEHKKKSSRGKLFTFFEAYLADCILKLVYVNSHPPDISILSWLATRKGESYHTHRRKSDSIFSNCCSCNPWAHRHPWLTRHMIDCHPSLSPSIPKSRGQFCSLGLPAMDSCGNIRIQTYDLQMIRQILCHSEPQVFLS